MRTIPESAWRGLGFAALAGVAMSMASATTGAGGEPAAAGDVFAMENLVAWCIVPFDAQRRGPSERAEMLKRLGFRKFAYDWRDEHVPTFEQEILELKKRNIQFFAFWAAHDEAFRLFEKHGLHPQIWITAPSPPGANDEARVEAAARQLQALTQRAGSMGCALGLYNHGGWGGEPKNLVAVCKRLRTGGADHVGIVYNWHHGHEHIADWTRSLALMQPYLLCLNVNGMNDNGNPKILPLGEGTHERRMLQAVRESGYQGPIGILGHRAELDAEDALRGNLAGLNKLAP